MVSNFFPSSFYAVKNTGRDRNCLTKRYRDSVLCYTNKIKVVEKVDGDQERAKLIL